tara:strand:+ start:100 stop:771 length:672 start_codon:yes stop_codon:yes gene_type:complete
MKTYNQFITELNKYEKFLLKQGIKAIKKFNPGQTFKAIKKSALRTTKGLRNDPNNPFVSPRRESENLVKQFQNTVPGQKGQNIMKLKDKTGKPKYVEYDPTRVRQGDSPQAKVTGAAQSMRGMSKKSLRAMDKDLKDMGKRFGIKQEAENARSILKNTGDQHSAIYKAPQYRVNPTDKKIDSTFTKNVLGAPTTKNIPKGAVPDASKKIDAKSIIKKFKRRKK